MNTIERIKSLREDNELTQNAIAQILHISQRAYSHYENESRKMPLDVLVAIANYYDYSVDYLLGRTNERIINK